MIQKLKMIAFVGSLFFIDMAFAAQIVTLDKDALGHLTKKSQTVNLDKEGLVAARETIATLKETLKPLMPAAGLAAPQIGLNERIFLFSWDRTAEHQAAVINPSFEPINEDKELGWESCFSIILGNGPYQAANVPRYKKIKVNYIDENGRAVTQILEGFGARVFQHEYDHLEGIENVHRADAEIKTFDTKEAIFDFMKSVKAKDKVKYIHPT